MTIYDFNFRETDNEDNIHWTTKQIHLSLHVWVVDCDYSGDDRSALDFSKKYSQIKLFEQSKFE